MTWQLQEAKNRLSEVVSMALDDGPQTITRHGRPAVVVVSCEEFRRGARREKLSDILRACPVRGWRAVRDKDRGRSVRLG